MKTNQEMIREVGEDEIWKDIKGYEGMYMVSNYGRVSSLRSRLMKIMTPSVTAKGYLRVSFHMRLICKQYMVHRLVALAFIPNVNGAPEINHKNGDKKDNRVSNLEWCTSKENSWHKFNVLKYKIRQETKAKLSKARKGKPLDESIKHKISLGHMGLKKSVESIEKTAKSHMKSVVQLDMQGNFVSVFNSIKEASLMTGANYTSISNVCNGKNKSANGYKWQFSPLPF